MTESKHKAQRPRARAKTTRHSAHAGSGPAGSGPTGTESSAKAKSNASATVPEPTDAERAMQLEAAALTGGLATDDYLKDWLAWCTTIAGEPAKQTALAQSALAKAVDTWKFVANAAMGGPLPPQAAVQGFSDPSWGVWPFNVFAHAYSNWATWVQQAVELGAQVPAPAASTGSGAPDPEAAQAARRFARLRFATQLLLDAASPANFLHMNPELVRKTVDESGQNLVRGLKAWLEDAGSLMDKKRPPGSDRFRVGRDVAVTPGKVVFRNRLIELLQYSPQTDAVHAEPILITPAWIMKYYILDLSPRNSLVRYLVEQGHTVFVISWKNPTREEKDLGLDDYVSLGFEAALDTVNRIVPGRKVHAVGYCIGGTLLAIAASLLAGKGDQRLATVTLLAALTDFSEPGELSVFITPAQLAMLEALMHKAGVLESERMAGAFIMLRSRDLLWKPAVDTYVRGERAEPNDLMAWNSDGTRMPWRMHNEYLNRLYLKNELAGGQFTVRGQRISLADLKVPMFVVGTETDHVAPWRAVYKARGLTCSHDYTFLLTSGGHNAGIVSGPSHPKRRHRILTWSNATDALPAEEWLKAAPLHSNSWWPTWQEWLVKHSGAQEPARPVAAAEAATGTERQDAPGTYVLE